MRYITVNKSNTSEKVKIDSNKPISISPVCQASVHRINGALPYMARKMCGCHYCKADLIPRRKSSMKMKAARLSDAKARPTVREMRRVIPPTSPLRSYESITDLPAQGKE